MRKKITEAQIISLALGELNDSDAEVLRREVMKDDELRNLLQTYTEVIKGTKSLPEVEPPSMVKPRFDDWLGQEISNQRDQLGANKISYLRFIKYAVAASVFIAIGLFIGTKFGENAVDDQIVVNEPIVSNEARLHWVDTESATTRIKGILETEAYIEADPLIRDALISVMRKDKSANVRLAAVEALSIYVQDEVIKEGLISALKVEKEPIVQIAIINTMVGLKEDGAKISLEEFIESDDIQPFVKDEARLGITRM